MNGCDMLVLHVFRAYACLWHLNTMYLEKAGYLLIYLIYVIKLNVMYSTLNEFASTLENFVVFLHKKRATASKV